MIPLRVAVVGAGWAGLAAAVHACDAGHSVVLFEMTPRAGGRARSVHVDGFELDNGQHILIGAYRETLALMRRVGVDPGQWLTRLPLALQTPEGRGLRLKPGHPVTAFIAGVMRQDGWTLRERLALLAVAASWGLAGFRCAPELTVTQLCRRLPGTVQRELIEPLCIAALNTPAAQASAAVMLRVLHDALFDGRGSSDLLLPRPGLDALLPAPATAWLAAHGAALCAGQRVMAINRDGPCWRVDGQAFDAVVLACSAAEAARLSAPFAADWSAVAGALRYEPIVTVYLRCADARLPGPMVALPDDHGSPAQFAFDLGALGGANGVFAFVVSGARDWVERGLPAVAEAVLAQSARSFPSGTWPQPPTTLHVTAEKRATFRCTPSLRRPAPRIADGVWAAGDYVEGPYPATLEGAVRSGIAAARELTIR